MKNAFKQASLLVAVVTLAAGLSAQTKKGDDLKSVAGTWDVNLMSHQVALVLEHDAKDPTKVSGTLMIMGKDVAVDGDFVDGKLTLTGKGALMGHAARRSRWERRSALNAVETYRDDERRWHARRRDAHGSGRGQMDG